MLYPSDGWPGTTLLHSALTHSHPPSPIAGVKQHRYSLDQALSSSWWQRWMWLSGNCTPWVFKAHPGGPNRNGGDRALVPTTVIIYWACVSVGTGGWWILMGLMITLPMRVINIMKSYWACAVVWWIESACCHYSQVTDYVWGAMWRQKCAGEIEVREETKTCSMNEYIVSGTEGCWHPLNITYPDERWLKEEVKRSTRRDFLGSRTVSMFYNNFIGTTVWFCHHYDMLCADPLSPVE